MIDTDLLNPYRHLIFTVIYKDNRNFSLAINENGLLSVYDHGTGYYKINGNGQEVLKQIEQFVLDSNIPKSEDH